MEPPYASLITSKLAERNVREVSSFRELVEGHTKWQHVARTLSNRVANLEREGTILAEENSGLQEAVRKAEQDARHGANSKANQEKAQALQTELNASYKKNSEVCQQLVEAQKLLAAAQESLQLKEDALTKVEGRSCQLEARVAELSGVVDHERAASAAVSHELEALQAEHASTAQQLRKLQVENSELVQRLMQMKLAEAEHLNEANAIYQDVVANAAAVQLASSVANQPPAARRLGGGGLPTTRPSRVRCSFAANAGGVHALAFSSTGSLLATAGADALVYVWESARPRRPSAVLLRGALQSVVDVAFSADDAAVLAGSADRALRLWDVASGRVKHTFTGHSDKVCALAFNPLDPTRAASVANDRCIKVWDLTKGFCTKSVVFSSTCNAVCFTGDGLICSGHFDGSLRFWDARQGDAAHEVHAVHQQQVTSVSLSPLGNQILTNSRDNTLKLLDLRSFEVVHSFKSPGYHVGSNWCRSCFSPDGQQLAAGSSDGRVFTWDVSKTISQAQTLSGHKGSVVCCAWSRAGLPLASADKNGECVLWH